MASNYSLRAILILPDFLSRKNLKKEMSEGPSGQGPSQGPIAKTMSKTHYAMATSSVASSAKTQKPQKMSLVDFHGTNTGISITTTIPTSSSSQTQKTQQRPQPIPIFNTFSPLQNKIPQNQIETPSQIPKKTFSQQLTQTNPIPSTKSTYQTKYSQTVLFIEPEMDSSMGPYKLLKTQTNGSLFIEADPRKTQRFYEFILVDTDSVVVTHNVSPTDSNDITHSKLQIKKVLTLTDWGMSPTTPKKFSQTFNPPAFTYWDYVDAWTNVIFFQNKLNRHSWFIFFCKNFRQTVPIWFRIWWANYGATISILPDLVTNSFKEFYNNFQHPNLQNFDPLFSFFSNFNISWILSWDLVVSEADAQEPPMLIRRIKIKWWDGFKTDRLTIPNVRQWFQQNPQFSKNPQNSQFLLQKSHIQSKLATAQTKKEYKKQVLELLSQLSSDEEEDDASSSQCHLQDNEDDCFGILDAI